MNEVLVGDCFKVLPTLEAESVDLCVTSPPYWELRDYGVEEQLGLEDHPQKYVDNMVKFGRLVRDVLKPSGLFWLNLGDTYYGSWGNYGARDGKQRECINPSFDRRGATPEDYRPPMVGKSDGKWLQPKQLLMIPARVACALQDDGWILRSDVIWHKPNHMPESVTDRFTKSYEHFFMFSKEQKYYFDLNAVREPHQSSSIDRDAQGYHATPMSGRYNVPWESREIMLVNPTPTKISKTYKGKNMGKGINSEALGSPRARNSRLLANTGENNKEPYKGNNPHLMQIKEVSFLNPNGKNPGDIWEINTQPFPGSHFAVFPENLVKRIIKCSSPPKGVVLDPFAGSGTTLRVARQLGRSFIGIELNPEYAKMAEQRIRGRNFRLDLDGIDTSLLASKSDDK